MRLSDFRKIAKRCIDANVPCRVWGPGAIGKSEVLKDLGKELGYYVQDLRLATHEVGDLIGMPDTVDVTDANGTEHKITTYAKPSWLYKIWQLHHSGTPTILALEEKARAPKEVTQAAFQMLTDHKIHEHDLPPDCRIIGLDNPPTEEYDVAVSDRAENTRWANIYCTADADDWIENYGVESASPELVHFIAGNKKALCQADKKNWDVGTVIYNTPRTWALADRIWLTFKEDFEPSNDDMLMELRLAVGACVGAGPAAEFVSSLISKWISIDDLLNGTKTFEKDLKGNPDLQIRAFFGFLHYLQDTDLQTDTGKPDKAKISRLGDFIVGMDSEGYRDLAVSLIKKFHTKKSTTGKRSNIIAHILKYGPKEVKLMLADVTYEIATINGDY